MQIPHNYPLTNYAYRTITAPNIVHIRTHRKDHRPMDQLSQAVRKRGDIRRIAQLAGLNHSTVARIFRGITTRPAHSTVTAIQQAVATLNAQEPATDAADH